MSRNQLIIVAVAVLVVIGAAFAYYAFPTSTSADVLADTGGNGGPGYTIAADDHTMGKRNAPITVIEYAAPTCPHCAHFDANVFPTLKASYIDTGKVFYVFRVFPLHPSDGAAEAMARCQPKDKYFQFIDLLFQNQAMWDWENGVQDIHAGLVKVGRIAGMSPQQVDSCIGNQTVQDNINKVAQDGQTRYNITGTPTFVVNGSVDRQGNMVAVESMQTYLDGLLAKK